MVDDPDRDILPVKEGSYADTLISAIDPRERHLICKLDRYELEDKYLRLLDEASSLKKLNNCQEDKIKRLGTKLIRLAGNPRSYGLSLDVAGNDKNRMSALEHENAKLKEKITVMRNQLLSHTMSGRSSSRSRNPVRPTSSGLVTCRSENNRSRAPSCQCIVDAGRDDSDVRNYLVKIEKLETQKKDMACRITDLEKELALYSANSQREKVADNVEYIRVWRQMNQLNEKLITSQDKNVALTAEINDLKTTIEQTTRDNQEIAAVLKSERTRIAEMDDQMMKAKNSQLALREKEEQIRDLTNEIKIMQQHNNELIALSSKYGQVEMENIELKKKLSENIHEQQSLRTAFNNDQANIVALQASNKQLLTKLQDLQATIDTLTVQLTSLHKQNEKRDVAITVPSDASMSLVSKKEENTSKQTHSASIEQCKKCCEMYDKVTQLEKAVDSARRSWQPSVKSVQTITTPIHTREQSVMTIQQTEEKINSRLQSPVKERKTNHETNSLSREKILKLLDQAQISTPLDTSMITQKEEYTDILDVAQTQRHSDGEIPSQTLCDEPNLVQKDSQKGRLAILENMASSQILLMLLEVLHEYLSLNNVDERTSLKRQVFTIEDTLIDVNNNFATKSNNHDFRTNRKAYPCKYQQTVACNTKDFVDIDERIHKSARMSSNCSNVKNCLANLESDCYPSYIPQEPVVVSTRNIELCTKETQDKVTCCSVIDGKSKKSSYRDVSDDNDCTEKVKTSLLPRCDLMCHLRKQKDSPTEREKRTACKSKCLGDKVQLSVGSAESFPLLISDKQGLIEIHVSQLQLSTSASKISGEEDLCNLYLYISWDIWDEKTAYTMAMRCPNMNFNFSSVYRIADLSSFFKNVLLEYLAFRVNVVRHDDTRYTIARARVSIKDILDYPQNKLHYIVPVNSIISCTYGVNFGQLSLWVRLSCDVEMVEAFKEQCGIASLRDTAPQDTLHARFPAQVKISEDRKDSESAVLTDNRYLRPPIDLSEF
ncbi:uveal autoantigen with coiled-coil domains and ankyrin repeats protein-like isoform X1 [Odontomachus brunneus]|uniref:uveal autoantigen with coiled-coil domains and ankyrin repeats protein-like isoform X1 n=1 Tax=Odontomachus brunneus TaxID=486640 RepID=UPI0013F29837|nr:uveal autoantigen with coiled-coil domains and ankyrin repeats protein-like isoform X1 [Odontomachus brunneus]